MPEPSPRPVAPVGETPARRALAGRGSLSRIAGRAVAAAGVLVVGAYSIAALAGGLVVPPAVTPAGRPDWSPVGSAYPAEIEAVAVRCPDGTVLRGVYLDADTEAPVVLHLMASGSSVCESPVALEALRSLRDRGLASLALDWRGVGRSDGPRDSAELMQDARTLWAEAIRRAGAHEDRVVLRGISLGTLAIAQLLAEGARPAAVLLHAPVRSTTVNRTFARHLAPAWVVEGAQPLLRPLVPTDLVDMLAAGVAPTFIHLNERDELLAPGDGAVLASAARAGGAELRFGEPAPGLARLLKGRGASMVEHLVSAVESFDLVPGEADFLESLGLARPDLDLRRGRLLARVGVEDRSRLTGDARRRARLDDLLGRLYAPGPHIAIAICDGEGPVRAAAEWVAIVERTSRHGEHHDPLTVLMHDVPADHGLLEAARELLAARLDLTDPAGPPTPAMLADAYALTGARGGWGPWTIEEVLRAASALHSEVEDWHGPDGVTEFGIRLDASGSGWKTLEMSNGRTFVENVDLRRLVAGVRGDPPRDARRRLVRALLTSAGHAQRARGRGDDRVLEVLARGTWRAVDLDVVPWPGT